MSPTASSLGGGAVIFSNPYLLGRREGGGPFPSHLASGARSVPAWARIELCFLREDISSLISAITLHSNYFKLFDIYFFPN